MKQLTDHLYQISLGAVNAYLIEDDEGLALVDTGAPGSTGKLLAAIRAGGKRPEAINRILLTHWHPDHAGNAAGLQQQLGARVWAHAAEADLLESGGGSRPRYLTPGLVNWLIFNLAIKGVPGQIAPVRINERVADHDVLPIAGGLRAIHTPGHSAGHMALLLEQDGVLIAGDLCAHVMGLAYSTVNEDIGLAQQSLLKAAAFDFDQAVFGHGGPLRGRASQQLKARFEQANPAARQPLKAV